MAAADARDVLGAVAAADQDAALFRLFGFVQLALVELHRTGILDFGAAGVEMDLGVGSGAEHEQGGDTEDFFHSGLFKDRPQKLRDRHSTNI